MGLLLPQYIERPAPQISKRQSGRRRNTNPGYDYDCDYEYSSLREQPLQFENNGYTYSYNYTSVHPASSYSHTHPSSSELSHNSRSGAHKQPFRTYVCRECRTHISSTHEIISQQYRGKDGDAYLMSRVANVLEGASELRTMFTGDYVVCDIEFQWCLAFVWW